MSELKQVINDTKKAAKDIPLAQRILSFALILLCYIMYAYNWNTEGYIRPFLMDEFGWSKALVGYFYTAQSLGALLGAVLFGVLADTKGKKVTLSIIVAGFGVSSFFMSMSQSFLFMFASRLALGIFLGGTFGVVVSMYVGLFPQKYRGICASIVGFAYTIASVIMGWIASFPGMSTNWRGLVRLGALPSFLVVALLLIFAVNDRKIIPYGMEGKKAEKVSFKQMFAKDVRRLTIILTLFSALSFFGYQAFAGWITTYLNEESHIAPEMIGLIFAMQSVGGLFGNVAFGILSNLL